MVSLSLRMANSVITYLFFIFSDEQITDLVSFQAILFAFIYSWRYLLLIHKEARE